MTPASPQPPPPGPPGIASREARRPLWPFILACFVQAIAYCILLVVWFAWTFADAGGDGTPPPDMHHLAVQTNLTIGGIALVVAAAVGVPAWLAGRRDIARLELMVIVLVVAVTAYFVATTPLVH
jgi:hypothetical protein